MFDTETYETTPNNLDDLQLGPDQIKDILGWRYQPLPNGDYLWTTKLGHDYTTSGRSH